MVFLDLNEVLLLHESVLQQTGGLKGVRDMGALESAISQPQMIIFGQDLYPNTSRKSKRFRFFTDRQSSFSGWQ